MHEHIARVLYYGGVHLLYASLVWMAAWILTSIPLGSATVKHWIWFATSVNFMLPAGAVVDRLFASHLTWARPLAFIGDAGLQIAENTALGATLAVVWLLGAGLMAARLYARLRTEHRHWRATANDERPKAFLAHGVLVTLGENCLAPAVHGILRPSISLPGGIGSVLSEPELNAVLIHEVTHARRRDNLIRLLQEAGLCALWFHPLVWIAGSRLALYRELSCDESVIRNAGGGDLVSALAKLASPEKAFLLQADASSFLEHRLERLNAANPQAMSRAAGALLTVFFAAALAGGVWLTVAHTACCFLLRK
jgi:beta-lactamase regulating signal transducer with metallopeptidase domain